MQYKSLEDCLLDLERNHQLIRIKEEVDPFLEMAAIHLRVFAKQGPALLFENIKGTRFRAASNIFGTPERNRFIFRENLQTVQKIIELKNDPFKALKNPFRNIRTIFASIKSIPLKNPVHKPVLFEEIKITDLPLIHHWNMDGGAFVTLPQVYTEDPGLPGIHHANLGMYRIQLTGNDYETNKEIGLHYQLHRGIGVHHTKAVEKGVSLKVSVFIGGPPSHTVAAIMPLPEGMSEMRFAGILGGRRFRYFYKDGFCFSADADFVITGEVLQNENKTEGPFGDHLGYYSLQHLFPVLKVHKVYAKKNAIWAFTVVGRPPQEDTGFGKLIHEISGSAIAQEIPGLKEIHAVDAAGVHPLLLAIGSERYTPYMPVKQPAEILTIANHILGTGQLSLAKFLWITAIDDEKTHTQDIPAFFNYILKRIDWKRDIHFYTNTTIDTLDYSGDGLNTGSKVVFAAYGAIIRSPEAGIPDCLEKYTVKNCLPGILAVQLNPFTNHETVKTEMELFCNELKNHLPELHNFPLLVICDDAGFTSATLNNFLWICFTRANPSHDIYGVDSFVVNKHWGCNGPVCIDARIKPHHAPVLEILPDTLNKIAPIFDKGGSLEGW